MTNILVDEEALRQIIRGEVKEAIKEEVIPTIIGVRAQLAMLNAKMFNLLARMTNSAKNHLETLTKVPRLQDGLLPPDSAEYPRNVASLLGVSGNETEQEEIGPSSRRRRLKLASLIGVSVQQLNAAEAVANYLQYI